jgi:hypothetical protein
MAIVIGGRAYGAPGSYRSVAHKSGEKSSKLAKVRKALHANLDGKGNGFIVGWRFDSKEFVLTIDKTRYEENMVYAATMAARSIFDLEGVRLPARLVIKDRSGEVLGSGPFSNVPRLVE